MKLKISLCALGLLLSNSLLAQQLNLRGAYWPLPFYKNGQFGVEYINKNNKSYYIEWSNNHENHGLPFADIVKSNVFTLGTNIFLQDKPHPFFISTGVFYRNRNHLYPPSPIFKDIDHDMGLKLSIGKKLRLYHKLFLEPSVGARPFYRTHDYYVFEMNSLNTPAIERNQFSIEPYFNMVFTIDIR